MSYYDRHKEERLAYQKAYNEVNKEKYVEYQRKYFIEVIKPKKPIVVKPVKEPRVKILKEPAPPKEPKPRKELKTKSKRKAEVVHNIPESLFYVEFKWQTGKGYFWLFPPFFPLGITLLKINYFPSFP